MMSDIKNIDSFADFLSERKEIEQISIDTIIIPMSLSTYYINIRL